MDKFGVLWQQTCHHTISRTLHCPGTSLESMSTSGRLEKEARDFLNQRIGDALKRVKLHPRDERVLRGKHRTAHSNLLFRTSTTQTKSRPSRTRSVRRNTVPKSSNPPFFFLVGYVIGLRQLLLFAFLCRSRTFFGEREWNEINKQLFLNACYSRTVCVSRN